MKPKNGEYHAVENTAGHMRVQECSSEAKPIALLHKTKSGKPIPKDAVLYQVNPVKDGHVKLKEVRLGKGPVAVTTPAYRQGWENVFGDRQVN